MSSPTLRNNVRSSPARPLAGPHVCSKVGANVSNLLRAAMVEMCERRGGKLSKDEIDHVFDLVAHSSELFPVFQMAYSNCVGMQNSSPFVEVDDKTISRFIVGAFCRDVIAKVLKAQIKAKGARWIQAFTDGFTTFLTNEIEPDLPKELFSAYKMLALSCSEPLTPVTILNAQDVVGKMGRTIIRMERVFEEDQTFLKRLESTANKSIDRALQLRGPSMDHLNVVSATAFMSKLSEKSESNPFRTLVLTATRAA